MIELRRVRSSPPWSFVPTWFMNLGSRIDVLSSALPSWPMADRKLIIVRFIGATPSTAYCNVCRLAFRTKQELLQDADKAKAQLQSEFEQHECRPEESAVNDALTQIQT